MAFDPRNFTDAQLQHMVDEGVIEPDDEEIDLSDLTNEELYALDAELKEKTAAEAEQEQELTLEMRREYLLGKARGIGYADGLEKIAGDADPNTGAVTWGETLKRMTGYRDLQEGFRDRKYGKDWHKTLTAPNAAADLKVTPEFLAARLKKVNETILPEANKRIGVGAMKAGATVGMAGLAGAGAVKGYRWATDKKKNRR